MRLPWANDCGAALSVDGGRVAGKKCRRSVPQKFRGRRTFFFTALNEVDRQRLASAACLNRERTHVQILLFINVYFSEYDRVGKEIEN